MELLARVFREHLASCSQSELREVGRGILGRDICFLIQAIEVVASHQMPLEFDQQSTHQRKLEVLDEMEKKLRALSR